MEQSPFLKDYDFDLCYAVELTKKQRALPTSEMMEQVENLVLDEDDLVKRLKKRIKRFKPDVLIVHYGFVFHRFPRQMSSALITVSSEFPKLRIGIEEGEPIGSELGAVIDNGDEVRTLTRELF